MSLVETLFQPEELEAMRQAVISATSEPPSKRRKVEGRDNVRDRRTSIIDSAYGSEEEKSPSDSATSPDSEEGSQHGRRPSVINHSNTQPISSLFSVTDIKRSSSFTRLPNTSNSESSSSPQPSQGAHLPENDPEYCRQQITLARALLYQGSSSLPSPPDSQHEESVSEGSNQQSRRRAPQSEDYGSLLADSKLPTFINHLGLSVTSQERVLLSSLLATAPRPPQLPVNRSIGQARRRATEPSTKKRTIYPGFAISAHFNDSDDEADTISEKKGTASTEKFETRSLALPDGKRSGTARRGSAPVQ